MIVSRVVCHDWRNISECDIPLKSGINVLWGMNAQGKSNILESIYFFARGRSFRGAKERELIRFGSDFSVIRIDFRRDGYMRDTALEAVIPLTGKKRLSRNDAPLTAAEMMGTFRAVLFCPANLMIVSGGPLERRTFLDIAISQISPKYLSHIRRYSKLLGERNALLKRAAGGNTVSREEWEVYAEALSESAAWISAFRREYVGYLGEAVGRYFAGMTDGRETPAMTYSSQLPDSGIKPLKKPGGIPDTLFLVKKLTGNIDREILAGSTLYGTHKDDVLITLNGRDAKLYASQGQQRSIALSMKLAEAEIAAEIGGDFPVILLDDVFSELDVERRHYILDSLGKSDERQIIITSCEPDVIPRSDSEDVNFLRIENGVVLPRKSMKWKKRNKIRRENPTADAT